MKIHDADIKKVKNYLMSLPVDNGDKKMTEKEVDGFINSLVKDETGFEVAMKMAKENKIQPQSCAHYTLWQVVNCE